MIRGAAIGLLTTCLLIAQRDAALQRAERAYRLGDYAAAAAGYREALGREYDGQAALLHNLGNCAVQLGELADAALLYRRALLRRPGAEGTVRNLALVEARLGLDPSRAVAAAPLRPVAPWLVTTVVLQCIGLGLLARRSGAGRRAGAIAFACGALAAGRTCWLQWGSGAAQVVVLVPTAVRAAPDAGAPVVTAVAPGACAEVVEQRADWWEVAFDGRRGWIELAAIGRVD